MQPIKSLFPYPGGKSTVVGEVHRRMGRVANRVEPFAGTAVWSLTAPEDSATTTINDADGFLTNCYRAIAADPDAVARWVDWPVSELDLHARHRWLIARREGLERRLRDDPDAYDVQIAGWWLWGICQWIGDGWCPRPSHAHPPEQLPHLGNAGMGVPALLAEYSRRLRRARLTCGDWRRVLTPAVTERHGVTAIFLDPPYQAGEHAMYYGGGGGEDVWEDAWQWATANGANPLLRIALCGYVDGREPPPGWDVYRWKAQGGYGSQGNGRGRQNAAREVIYFSPHCLNDTPLEALLKAQEAA